jgi:hypothetical protein
LFDKYISGAAATPTKYEVTIKVIEFYNSTTGAYVPFATGSFPIDLGSGKVAMNGLGGAIGEGASLTAGTYNKIRVTVSRDFNMNASADNVGPDVTPTRRCVTGLNGTVPSPGGLFTVNRAVRDTVGGVAAIDQIFSIPPQADVQIIHPGVEIVNHPTNDLRVTADIQSFTVLPNTTTLPGGISVTFDVANTVEFLNVGAGPGYCYAIVLPPTVTVTGPDGVPHRFAMPIV